METLLLKKGCMITAWDNMGVEWMEVDWMGEGSYPFLINVQYHVLQWKSTA